MSFLPHPPFNPPSSSSTLLLRDWKSLIASQPLVSNDFTSSISHFPTENATAHFTSAQFNAGAPEWSLSLVGYSIGRRPYYEALLTTIKKAWNLKGSLSLLTLDDGFFLLKFNNREDYDMAWSGGPWFFFGKPFILQKWTPDFTPVREEFPSIPLWIKIKNFPLSCWTPEGISKIASCVGIPLAVDALTAAKTRLTFARVCVQVSSASPLPDVIYYTVDDKTFPLTVLYDWKPSHCSFCNSIMHSPNTCPKNPTPQLTETSQNRGRSTSRKPRKLPPRLNIPKPPSSTTFQSQPPPPSTSLSTDPPTAKAVEIATLLPNLNSPSEDFIPPSPTTIIIPSPTLHTSPPVPTKNKFDALTDQDHLPESSSAQSDFHPSSSTTHRDQPDKPPDSTKKPNTSSNSQPTPQNVASTSTAKSTRAKSAKKATTPTSKSQ
ncbi:uncharacterized protein PB18E9.04c-like [Dendrobium catenatum]|uniref:uncharacterized protein PB18E9.04c-like n=1 Tax=Dendrobium catenatum TaxID=906689 RepID=UPI0010A01014|nr:uncharacterized protein PB18E9.04c-like [Dendrobium catenatum]